MSGKKSNPEHRIQVACVQYLDTVLPDSIRAVAVANNPRSRVAGAMEKARGMRKGFPDLLLIGDFVGLIEFKAEGQYLRPEQKEWQTWAKSVGVHHAVCRSVDDVTETLAHWGIKTRESA